MQLATNQTELMGEAEDGLRQLARLQLPSGTHEVFQHFRAVVRGLRSSITKILLVAQFGYEASTADGLDEEQMTVEEDVKKEQTENRSVREDDAGGGQADRGNQIRFKKTMDLMAPVLPPQPLVDAANFFEPILVPELNAMQILSVEQLRASTLATFKKKKKMRKCCRTCGKKGHLDVDRQCNPADIRAEDLRRAHLLQEQLEPTQLPQLQQAQHGQPELALSQLDKRQLKSLKRKLSSCHLCGVQGHWARDGVCKQDDIYAKALRQGAAQMQPAQMQQAQMQQAQFQQAQFQQAQMQQAQMQQAQIQQAQIQHAQMLPPQMQQAQMLPPQMQLAQMLPPQMQRAQMLPPQMQQEQLQQLQVLQEQMQQTLMQQSTALAAGRNVSFQQMEGNWTLQTAMMTSGQSFLDQKLRTMPRHPVDAWTGRRDRTEGWKSPTPTTVGCDLSKPGKLRTYRPSRQLFEGKPKFPDKKFLKKDTF